MPRTTIDKTKPLDPAELREQTWRVLLLDEPNGAGEPRWHEVDELTGASEYGYRPDAVELGKSHGAGTYLLVERVAEGRLLGCYELVVGTESLYFDAVQRAEHERLAAERAAEAEAAEAELDA